MLNDQIQESTEALIVYEQTTIWEHGKILLKKKASYRPISSAGNTAITHSKAEIGLPTSHFMKSQNIQYFTLCL